MLVEKNTLRSDCQQAAVQSEVQKSAGCALANLHWSIWSCAEFSLCQSAMLAMLQSQFGAVGKSAGSCQSAVPSVVLGKPKYKTLWFSVALCCSNLWFWVSLIKTLCCAVRSCLGPSGRPSLADRLLPTARGATIAGEGFPRGFWAVCNLGLFYAVSVVLFVLDFYVLHYCS